MRGTSVCVRSQAYAQVRALIILRLFHLVTKVKVSLKVTKVRLAVKVYTCILKDDMYVFMCLLFMGLFYSLCFIQVFYTYKIISILLFYLINGVLCEAPKNIILITFGHCYINSCNIIIMREIINELHMEV